MLLSTRLYPDLAFGLSAPPVFPEFLETLAHSGGRCKIKSHTHYNTPFLLLPLTRITSFLIFEHPRLLNSEAAT